MQRIFLLAAVMVCCLCAVLVAKDAKEKMYMPKGVQAAVQTFKRDCPMCGWNALKKRSNDKPAKKFDGAFARSSTCPFCGGAGKVHETIDWAEGYVEAYGVGVAEQRSTAKDPAKRKAQDLLMARRAAEVRAKRNAVALLANLRLDLKGAAESGTYKQAIEATVKGAECSEVASNHDAQTPYYVVKARVPLWGVKGLSASLWSAYSKGYGARVGQVAAPRAELEEEYVIIIDARGTDCPPHLFPRIVTEKGAVVYDITVVNKDVARSSGMARFGCLKEDIPFEKLQESLKQSALDETEPGLAGQAYGFAFDGDGDEAPPEKEDKKRRRRKKINLVVKSKKKGGEGASVVVSEADAGKMKEADKKTDSLKGGKVIVITDSRVAGKEGRIITFGRARYACRK